MKQGGIAHGVLNDSSNESVDYRRRHRWAHLPSFGSSRIIERARHRSALAGFQNWFRKNVLLSIDPSYLVGSIIIMVVGIVFMTSCVSKFKNKDVVAH